MAEWKKRRNFAILGPTDKKNAHSLILVLKLHIKVRVHKTVRDTSSNDTSSTATLRRKFLSNYQFVEK